MAGEQFTYADIVAYYSFAVAEKTMKKVYGWDVMDEVAGLRQWRETVAPRPIVHSMDRVVAR